MEGKRLVRVTFRDKSSFEPVIANLVLTYRTPVNILYADTKNIGGAAEGEMILQLPEIEEVADKMIQYLKEYYPEKKVYLVGTPDLEENFRENGILLTREMPDVVVIGFDMTLTYEKLERACTYIATALCSWQRIWISTARRRMVLSRTAAQCARQSPYRPERSRSMSENHSRRPWIWFWR